MGIDPLSGLILGVAFDEGLAERVRDLAGPHEGPSERKMFGGLCFMVDGNTGFGVVASELMVRDQRPTQRRWALPNVREMDFTGRSTRGMVFVSEDGISQDENLGNG